MDRVREVLLGEATGPVATSGPPPAGTPAPDGSSTLATPPAHAGTGPRRARRATRRRHAALTAGAVAVIVTLTAVAFVLGLRDDAPPAAGPDPASSSPTDPTSPSGSSPTGPTAEGIETFVADYLQAAAADPASAFTMLTPEFQEASGGLTGYRGFWGTVADARLLSVQARPGEPAVSYRVRYTRDDGSTWTDPQPVRLRLEYQDGRYWIAGES